MGMAKEPNEENLKQEDKSRVPEAREAGPPRGSSVPKPTPQHHIRPQAQLLDVASGNLTLAILGIGSH